MQRSLTMLLLAAFALPGCATDCSVRYWLADVEGAYEALPAPILPWRVDSEVYGAAPIPAQWRAPQDAFQVSRVLWSPRPDLGFEYRVPGTGAGIPDSQLAQLILHSEHWLETEDLESQALFFLSMIVAWPEEQQSRFVNDWVSTYRQAIVPTFNGTPRPCGSGCYVANAQNHGPFNPTSVALLRTESEPTAATGPSRVAQRYEGGWTIEWEYADRGLRRAIDGVTMELGATPFEEVKFSARTSSYISGQQFDDLRQQLLQELAIKAEPRNVRAWCGS
jgi:hypothetical protein